MSKEPFRLTSKQAAEFRSALLGHDLPSLKSRLFGTSLASVGAMASIVSFSQTVLAAPKYCAVVLELVNTGSTTTPTREITTSDNVTGRVIAKESLHAGQKLIVDAPSTDGVKYEGLKISLGDSSITFNGPCVNRDDPRWVVSLGIDSKDRLVYFRPGEPIPDPRLATSALASATVTARDIATAYRGINNLYSKKNALEVQNSDLRDKLNKIAIASATILTIAGGAFLLRGYQFLSRRFRQRQGGNS